MAQWRYVFRILVASSRIVKEYQCYLLFNLHNAASAINFDQVGHARLDVGLFAGDVAKVATGMAVMDMAQSKDLGTPSRVPSRQRPPQLWQGNRPKFLNG